MNSNTFTVNGCIHQWSVGWTCTVMRTKMIRQAISYSDCTYSHMIIFISSQTDIDRQHMGHNEKFWFEDGVKESDISYHPPEGFPVWFYPKKKNYKTPAVMVHFNTIRTNHLVTIKCVAWAKNLNNGQPQDSNFYSVKFLIR